MRIGKSITKPVKSPIGEIVPDLERKCADNAQIGSSYLVFCRNIKLWQKEEI